MIDLKEGDRIELLAMPGDPDPVPAGTLGTVQRVHGAGFLPHDLYQIGVQWDNGRSLMMCCPPDSYRKLEGGP